MISIIISTYNDEWLQAHRPEFERAMASAHSQTIPVEVLWEHGETLASARNRGAENASGDRLVFLDADDTLGMRYAEKTVEYEDVLQPLTTYFRGGYQMKPAHYIEPRENLLDGNHLIVGCPVNRDAFLDVGGFDEWPVYEDWALWLKLDKAGATFGKTTGTYHISMRQDSRNNHDAAGIVYEQIRNTYR